MKNKILLQGHGWILVTPSVHQVQLGGSSEQAVSHPCHANAQEERIFCSGADFIRLQGRNKNPSGTTSKTFLWSFTTLNAGDVPQGVLRPRSSDVPSGQHLQGSTALSSPDSSRRVGRNTASRQQRLKRCRLRVVIQSFRGTLIQITYAYADEKSKKNPPRRGAVISRCGAFSLQQKRWRIQGLKWISERTTRDWVLPLHSSSPLTDTHHPLKKHLIGHLIKFVARPFLLQSHPQFSFQLFICLDQRKDGF